MGSYTLDDARNTSRLVVEVDWGRRHVIGIEKGVIGDIPLHTKYFRFRVVIQEVVLCRDGFDSGVC